MRLLPATMLVGAATAAAPPFQQVMGIHQEQLEDVVKQGSDAFKASSDVFSKPLEQLKEQFKTMSGEARELWEEVSNYFPNSMDHAPMLSLPKKHTRRPDSHWDHIVSGQEVQSVWVAGSDGTKEREVDGKLEAFDLRVKKVDPSVLGVDPDVKQYSGYLDDNENDKHLFYCEFFAILIVRSF
jgi:cathepsin A (carboxypeptidase C)